jgi:hypothetical protein
MARRSAQPALYEMMRNRGAQGGQAAPSTPTPSARPTLRLAEDDEEIEVMRDDASPSPVLERIIALLKPGQTVRLPVGYLFGACAGVILLMAVAYVIGVSAGKSIQTAAFHEKFGDGFEISSRRGGVNDPLTLDALDGSHTSAPQAGSGAAGGSPRTEKPATPSNTGNGGRSAMNWGPVVPAIEPRQKGWNYFIAATNTLARCTQLAEFCRNSGLETYVVPHKNGGQVIVFPGFQGPRDAPAVKALEERIHQVGDRYKAANKYETNMRDAYPSKYDG